MLRIEQLAIDHGAVASHLDTYSFQALPFYERLGYSTFGSLADYPPGFTRTFLMKKLQ